MSYRPATWRCTQTATPEGVGVAFNIVGSDEVVRLLLDHESTKQLAQTLLQYAPGRPLPARREVDPTA